MVVLTSINGWHWLAVALVLFVLQASTSRLLLAPAVAALAVAALLAVEPVQWPVQLGSFALVTLAAGAVYWRWFKPPSFANATSRLRKRQNRLLGMRASLLAPIKAGRGTVQLQNALWPVVCGQDLPAGTLVEVTGYDNDTLHVSKTSTTQR